MATPPLSDEVLQEAVDAYRYHGHQKGPASRALGMSRNTFCHRLKLAVPRGLIPPEELIPGFVYTSVSTRMDGDGNPTGYFTTQKPERPDAGPLPEGHRLKGISRYTDGQGRLIGQWEKTVSDGPDPVEIVRLFRESLNDYRPDVPLIPAPAQVDADTLSLYPLADWHIGAAAKKWGLEESARHLIDTASRVVAAQDPTETALMVIGGDFTDIDNIDGLTPRHKNPLKPSADYKDVLYAARDIALAYVNLLLQKHKKVDVVAIPGNHDETTYLAVKMFLDGHFHNEPRVSVTDDDDGFYGYMFDNVMLFFHHGHEVKLSQISQKMAALYPKYWGDTEYRYGHTFHIHHKSQYLDEQDGAIVESHQSPAPRTQHIRTKGYVAGRGIQSILYHRLEGEWDRVNRPIREW